jgi:hypothetical protein
MNGLALLLAMCGLSQRDADDSYMRRLALEGNVTSLRQAVSMPGLDANTQFELTATVKWTYEIEILQRGGTSELRLTPHFTRNACAVRHVLRLPEGEDLDSRRYRVLLLHEYDHVAISTDERPRILMKKLVEGIGTMKMAWSGPIPPPEKDMNALIAAQIEARKSAIVQLIEDAYRRLDKASDHGRKAHFDRSVFFGSVYTPAHLKSVGFRFLGDALEIANSPEYLAGHKYYRY